MKKLRNFKCQSCNKTSERIVPDEIKTIDCECGGNAIRAFSAPKLSNNSCGKNASWSNN